MLKLFRLSPDKKTVKWPIYCSLFGRIFRMNQNSSIMGSFKSVNMIIALVWLYFAFTASVLYNEATKPSLADLEKTVIERAVLPSMSAEAKQGKPIFKSNCASCHNKNMTTDLTGPALKGIRERWAEFPTEDLYNWIRNSDKLTAAKHPRALLLKKEWNNDKMTSFEHLSDENIAYLIEYIEREG